MTVNGVNTDTLDPVSHEWLPADGDSPPAAPDEPHTAGTPGWRRGVGGALAFLLAGVAGGAAVGYEVWRPSSASTGSVAPASGPGALPNGTGSAGTVGPGDAASIAQIVGAGVVDINTTIGYQNARAAGTGMVLTSTGEILTNNHVISGATRISVTDVGNGRTYRATVVGYDKSDDVAVLQLQGASGLTTIRPATSAVGVGAGVVGVGNAGGTGGAPSYAGGVVTAVDQSITASDASDGTSEQLTGLLQTNANIVAGDSGGPLANTHGEVVGMDTAASAGTRFSQTSDGFAIPIATALQIAGQIEAGEASATVHIGPTAMLGVSVQPDGQGGVVVADVVSGGAAEAAGITAGDTVVSVAGQSVSSATDLSGVLRQQRPDTNVTVVYLDGAGTQHTTTVHLEVGPPQ